MTGKRIYIYKPQIHLEIPLDIIIIIIIVIIAVIVVIIIIIIVIYVNNTYISYLLMNAKKAKQCIITLK